METNTKKINGELRAAAKKGHFEELKAALIKGVDANTKNEGVLLSAYYGHLNCLKYLLQEGASVNAANAMHETALHLSVQAGQLNCTKHLVDKGADITLTDDSGATPLEWAIFLRNSHCAEFLKQELNK